MSDRITQKFQELKKEKKKAFLAFLTAGDPSLKATEELVLAFADNGADIIELGVPFSDPLADGPVIQASYQCSLKNGTTLFKILETVHNIRKKSQVPLALMTSYNPIFHFGEERFVSQAKKAGVDGLIIPDLPPEEAVILIRNARRYDLATIFFLAPTTTSARRKMITKASTGFIYYISLTGVTGVQKAAPELIARNIREVKKESDKPLCVGFGVSTPQQVKDIAKIADGVIVGTAIVKEIHKNSGNKNLIKNVARFVSRLAKGLN